MGGDGAGGDIGLVDAGVIERLGRSRSDRDESGGVAEAMLPGADPGVVSRELVGPVVDPLLGHLAALGVDRPSIEGGHLFDEGSEAVGVHHALVAAEVDHDAACCVFVGVQRVEHIAGLDVAPHDGRRVVGVGTGARDETDTCGVLVVPGEREREALGGDIEVDRDGQVVDQRPVGGDRDVVDHRHAVDRDLDRARHLAVGTDHDVVEEEAAIGEQIRPGITHGVHLAGGRIELRVSRERTLQGVVERVAGNGVEFVAEFGGGATGLDHRPGLAGERAHVGVRAVL